VVDDNHESGEETDDVELGEIDALGGVLFHREVDRFLPKVCNSLGLAQQTTQTGVIREHAGPACARIAGVGTVIAKKPNFVIPIDSLGANPAPLFLNMLQTQSSLIRNAALVLFLVALGSVSAQEKQDSVAVSKVYKQIEEYSTQRKVTSLLHRLVLRHVCSDMAASSSSCPLQNAVPHSQYEGKRIRSIHIETLSPFGYSLSDSSKRPHSLLEKTGNALHVKTQHFTVNNHLLFRAGDRYDSLLVKESERLIRNEAYVHDVVVSTSMVGADSDSVDVFVRVSDFWSIGAEGTFSKNEGMIDLTEKNVAGLGHTFTNTFMQDYLDGKNAFSTSYFVPNINNSYVNARLSYTMDEEKDYTKILAVERPFFSAIARWAGGASLSQQLQPGWIYKNDTTRLYRLSKFNAQDYWAATAWQVFKGWTEPDRTTKLILSGRVYDLNYLEKPQDKELAEYYTNEHLYMGGLGISSRQYVKQRFLFRSGTAEDVPVGFTLGVTGGYQVKNSGRWYWGIHHSWGELSRVGYFGTSFDYGTFISGSKNTDGVFTANMNYFSNLIQIGNWKFRQFVKPELTVGLHRDPFNKLTLNDGYGLNGFNSDVLSGTSRFLLVLQTQSYAPWNVLNFRFGPYLNFSFGMIGNESCGFAHSRLYPQIGGGVLFRNDNLVVRYFQFSFAYYPSIPGHGDNIFKANPLRTTDFVLPDFVLGKPDVAAFH